MPAQRRNTARDKQNKVLGTAAHKGSLPARSRDAVLQPRSAGSLVERRSWRLRPSRHNRMTISPPPETVNVRTWSAADFWPPVKGADVFFAYDEHRTSLTGCQRTSQRTGQVVKILAHTTCPTVNRDLAFPGSIFGRPNNLSEDLVCCNRYVRSGSHRTPQRGRPTTIDTPGYWQLMRGTRSSRDWRR